MSNHKLPIAEQLKIATRISTENAINLDKGIVGQYNGTFPLTVANVGNIYYDPQSNKYYKCLVEYNGESIPSPTTDKFKEISITELENNKFEKGVTPTSLPNAEAIYKALQANIGVKFDENLLYLNDDGTKKLGLCYLDKLSDGIFECIKETNTKVNDSACFKNFSSKENSDKLGNLSSYIRTYKVNSKGVIGDIIEFESFYIIQLQTQKAFQNEVVIVEHNANITLPKGIHSVGLPPFSSSSSVSQNVKIGWRSFEILIGQTPLAPTAFLNACIPKF